MGFFQSGKNRISFKKLLVRELYVLFTPTSFRLYEFMILNEKYYVLRYYTEILTWVFYRPLYSKNRPKLNFSRQNFCVENSYCHTYLSWIICQIEKLLNIYFTFLVKLYIQFQIKPRSAIYLVGFYSAFKKSSGFCQTSAGCISIKKDVRKSLGSGFTWGFKFIPWWKKSGRECRTR